MQPTVCQQHAPRQLDLAAVKCACVQLASLLPMLHAQWHCAALEHADALLICFVSLQPQLETLKRRRSSSIAELRQSPCRLPPSKD